MADIVRYQLRERLVHAVASLSYVYLLLTGLAFWTPALYWLAIVLGGGYLSRVFHPWIGLVFVAATSVMWVVWRRDMRVTDEDRRWRQAMGRYVRNEDGSVPPAGRFNYGQKMLFWLMAGGGIVLLLSGLVLWFVSSVPGDLTVLRSAAALTHAVSALLTIGGFIVHVYMGVAVVPGGLQAIVSGGVSEEWARAHHPLWLAQLNTIRGTGHGEPSAPQRRR